MYYTRLHLPKLGKGVDQPISIQSRLFYLGIVTLSGNGSPPLNGFGRFFLLLLLPRELLMELKKRRNIGKSALRQVKRKNGSVHPIHLYSAAPLLYGIDEVLHLIVVYMGSVRIPSSLLSLSP